MQVEAREQRVPKARAGVYYGWWIVLVAFLASFVSAGIGGYGLGVFVKPMTESLGWSRTALSGFALVRSIIQAVVGPLLGPLVDRKQGARLLFVLGGLVAGAGLILLPHVTQVVQFYIAFGLVWGFGQVLLGGGIISGPIVSKWFIRYRGRAMAIAAMGVSGGGVVFVPLNAFLISRLGWQSAWVVLATLTWLIIVPAAALLMRRQPEDLGLLPDGERQAAGVETGAVGPAGRAAPVETSWTVREAARTPALWLLIAGFDLMTMSIGATLLHQVPYLTDKGLGLGLASTAAAAFGLVAMAGKIPWGLLAERFPVRYVAAACFLIAALGLLALVVSTSAPGVFLYVVLYGIGAGGPPVIQNVAWANYYGRRFQGSIRGVFAPFHLVGMGGAPIFAAWVYDTTKSYDLAFLVLMGGCIVAAGLILLARPPVHPSALQRTGTVAAGGQSMGTR